MDKQKCNTDFWIAFFSAIPEDKWTTNQYYDYDAGKACAYGHAMSADLHPELGRCVAHHEFLITEINDGRVPQYAQPTPKQRVLAFLEDIKAEEAVLEAQAIISTPVKQQEPPVYEETLLEVE